MFSETAGKQTLVNSNRQDIYDILPVCIAELGVFLVSRGGWRASGIYIQWQSGWERGMMKAGRITETEIGNGTGRNRL